MSRLGDENVLKQFFQEKLQKQRLREKLILLQRHKKNVTY